MLPIGTQGISISFDSKINFPSIQKDAFVFFFHQKYVYIYSITEFLTRTKNTINLLTSSLDINRPRTPKSMKKKT